LLPGLLLLRLLGLCVALPPEAGAVPAS
jgi:hypothetical protein